jgi:hypothetical protein
MLLGVVRARTIARTYASRITREIVEATERLRSSNRLLNVMEKETMAIADSMKPNLRGSSP